MYINFFSFFVNFFVLQERFAVWEEVQGIDLFIRQYLSTSFMPGSCVYICKHRSFWVDLVLLVKFGQGQSYNLIVCHNASSLGSLSATSPLPPQMQRGEEPLPWSLKPTPPSSPTTSRPSSGSLWKRLWKVIWARCFLSVKMEGYIVGTGRFWSSGGVCSLESR